MAKSKKSKYDTAFFVRIGILVPLLLLMVGGMVYDRAVLIPHGEKKVAEIMKAELLDDINAQAAVEKVAGQAPAETKTVGKFTVQEYRFGRILPFLKPHVCTAIFSEQGILVETYSGSVPAEELAHLK